MGEIQEKSNWKGKVQMMEKQFTDEKKRISYTLKDGYYLSN